MIYPCAQLFAGEEACTRRSSSSSSSRPRIAAPADRSTASAVLSAGGGTARLLAEAGSCLDSSFAGAEAEAVGSELFASTRGRATQARQSANVYLSLRLFRAHTTKYCIKIQKIVKTEHNGKTFSEKYEGPRTNQQINAPTIRCLDP